MERRRDVRLLLALAACSMAWLLVESVAGLHEGLLMLVPAILLALPLLVGRYFGEETIERVRVARGGSPSPHPRAARRAPLPRPALAMMPRGGLLLASSLATRPPPALG